MENQVVGSSKPSCQSIIKGLLSLHPIPMNQPVSRKPLSLALYFFKQMQNHPCIVFLGGYPYPSRLNDGYYQRVHSIVNQFPDFLQIHLDRQDLPETQNWLDQIQTHVLTISIRRNWVARIVSVLSILLARRLYVHSIYPLKYLQFFLKLPQVIKVVDFHGAVPEEHRVKNESNLANKLTKIEKLSVQKADYYIFVTEAMASHFKNKYKRYFTSKYLVIPIVPNLSTALPQKPPLASKPVVVYSGGLQTWQKIPEMIAAMKETKENYDFKVFTGQTEDFTALLSAHGHDEASVDIAWKKHNELIQIYRICHFGFLLRDNHIVNQIACPTKLIEYLACGIIPILDSEYIGDFYSLGMRFISLEDFLLKNLPEQEEYQKMIQDNFDIYQTIQQRYSRELLALKNHLLDC